MKLDAHSIVQQLSGSQRDLLRAFSTLLRDRALPLGLIAESDSHRIWDRHVLDSIRGVACVDVDERAALDLGTGAGLPGIPLAIALPATAFTLLEPKRRRVAFVELAVQELGLTNVVVSPLRAEQAAAAATLCLARAFAPPVAAWRAAERLLDPSGRLAYWAGRTWGEHEVREVRIAGATAEICSKPVFQWQGPLVIMTRSFSPSPKDHEPIRRSVRRDPQGPLAKH